MAEWIALLFLSFFLSFSLSFFIVWHPFNLSNKQTNKQMNE